MPKILVIGGTGTVGAAVVQQLLARQADLRLFVRDAKTTFPRVSSRALVISSIRPPSNAHSPGSMPSIS
jgi:nucleoside-diphosphate-sugar epimerase